MKYNIRKNIQFLKPYISARHEFNNKAELYLDANENPFSNGVNRYPDPIQHKLRNIIAGVKGVNAEQVFTGNGSDEIIDILIRIFCNPRQDNILILPPTYGMYAVSAAVNDVEVREVLLTNDFQPNAEIVLKTADKNSKLLFICSPNNPSGNLIHRPVILRLLEGFKGVVVIDEAYIDFCPEATTLNLLTQYANLFIMQTLSKAWGMAGIRVGIGIGNPKLIRIMDNVKFPYNISVLNAATAVSHLSNPKRMQKQVTLLLEGRQYITEELAKLEIVKVIYPSNANFILVKMMQATEIYHLLIDLKIVVRNRSNVILCNDCLRITVGNPDENKQLVEGLRKINQIIEKNSH
jgi:histidinol-phosphate aminotransferase